MNQTRIENNRRRRRGLVLFSVLAVAGLVMLLSMGSPEDLELWHSERLENQFSTDKLSEVQSFVDYRRLEEQVFSEMAEKIIARTETGPAFNLVRYSAGSRADPLQFNPDWNRSFELPVEQPVGGVLLLHGMSDSPYSLRKLGLSLHDSKFWVLGLRLPGHGTAPSALKYITWEDMAAAVRLAASHLREKIGDRPLHLIGYSNGAALALNYTIDLMSGADRTPPSSLILISPAIGIHPAAQLAGVKNWLSRLPGLARLAWLSIEPEFDPYKYNSFATNAGAQVSRLTRTVTRRLALLAEDDRVDRFPPVLVCKSTVDATVSNKAVVDNLLRPLGDGGHQLLIFDINRYQAHSPIIFSELASLSDELINDDSLPTTVNLLTNRSPETRTVLLRSSAPLSSVVAETAPVDVGWPPGVFSLSHVALPFPPDDPLYGSTPPEDEKQLYLGQMTVKGERGLLKIPADHFIRLRHNPFYSLLEERALDWVNDHSERRNQQ